MTRFVTRIGHSMHLLVGSNQHHCIPIMLGPRNEICCEGSNLIAELLAGPSLLGHLRQLEMCNLAAFVCWSCWLGENYNKFDCLHFQIP